MNQFDGVYGAMVFNLIGTVDLIGEYLFCIEGDQRPRVLPAEQSDGFSPMVTIPAPPFARSPQRAMFAGVKYSSGIRLETPMGVTVRPIIQKKQSEVISENRQFILIFVHRSGK